MLGIVKAVCVGVALSCVLGTSEARRCDGKRKCHRMQYCNDDKVCTTKLSYGDACTEDVQCVSKVCSEAGVCGCRNDWTCRQSMRTMKARCNAEQQCESTLVTPGESCVFNWQCQGPCTNGECSCNERRNILCPEGKKCENRVCVLDVVYSPLGGPCDEGQVCEAGTCNEGGICGCDSDGDCSDGEWCAPDGTCRDLSPYFGNCLRNSHCASGLCIDQDMCGCVEDSDCGPGAMCDSGGCKMPAGGTCNLPGHVCLPRFGCGPGGYVCACRTSDDCGDGRWCGPIGDCVAQRDYGEGCFDDSSCFSNKCINRQTCGCLSHSDCPDDFVCNVNTFTCELD